MRRRGFIAGAGAFGMALSMPAAVAAAGAAAAGLAPAGRRNLLILIELRGGNDGLNTVVPYADPAYRRLRPTIALPHDSLLHLDHRAALHPALLPLLPIWRAGELAIVEGAGYAHPNKSHFRSSAIWDTASAGQQYWREGWLTRALAAASGATSGAASTTTFGAAFGSVEPGPFAGAMRASFTALASSGTPAWLALAARGDESASASVSRARSDIQLAAASDPLKSSASQPLAVVRYADGAFGITIDAALRALAMTTTPGVPAIGAMRLTLEGFDTHHDQVRRQGTLLGQLASGLVTLRAALVALGLWQSTVVMTYSEFGRRPRENESRGTDHGTVAPHFVLGGQVRGGLFGATPQLGRLDSAGDLPPGVDFRRLYASVLDGWRGVIPETVLQGRFEKLPLLRS